MHKGSKKTSAIDVLTSPRINEDTAQTDSYVFKHKTIAVDKSKQTV